MSFTYALGKARTNSSGNPITTAYTVNAGDKVLCLMIKTVGATNRAGGAPTLSGGDPVNGVATFLQANSTQKAATAPEASAEIWYFLNPIPGSYTLTIPNTNAASIFYTMGLGRLTDGGTAAFQGASGANATSTNPNPGVVAAAVLPAFNIGFAITAGGWTTWAPSSQNGIIIANTDDGADGGGEQYQVGGNFSVTAMSWTFATSDDWGAVCAVFAETLPQAFNNYMGVDVGDGMSVTEKIR